MSQGILWLFDDPISDLLLVGILVSVFLHFREMKLLQQRTNQLAFQVSELKALIRTISLAPEGPSVDQRAPSVRFDETTPPPSPHANDSQRVSVAVLAAAP